MSRINKELENVDYSYGFLLKPKYLLILLSLFFATILIYTPFGKKIDSLVYSSLTSIPGCPINLGSYHFELFAPKLVLKNIKIPSRCIGSRGEDINLKEAVVYIRGLSFTPFGASFKVRTEIFNTPLEMFIIPSFTSISILMENESKGGNFTGKYNRIKLENLKQLIPMVKLKGELNVSTAYVQMGYNGQLKDLTLNIASKNFVIPAQTIFLLKLKPLKINNFLLQINSLNNNKIRLKKLVLGDEQAPIRSNFSGDMTLKPKRIKSSSLNVTGEVFFSEQFEKDYSIIKLFLAKFDKKDNFYQILIKGKLGKPEFLKAR